MAKENDRERRLREMREAKEGAESNPQVAQLLQENKSLNAKVAKLLENGEQEIRIANIRLGENVRKTINQESILELAATFETKGQLQAIGVAIDPETGEYVEMFGQRRILAAKHLGWETIRARVFKSIEDKTETQLIENLQKEEMEENEKRDAVISLLAKYTKRGGQSEVARILGKTRGWISQLVDAAEVSISHSVAIAAAAEAGVNLANSTLAVVSSVEPSLQGQVLEETIAAGGTRAAAQRAVKGVRNPSADDVDSGAGNSVGSSGSGDGGAGGEISHLATTMVIQITHSLTGGLNYSVKGAHKDFPIEVRTELEHIIGQYLKGK